MNGWIHRRNGLYRYRLHPVRHTGAQCRKRKHTKIESLINIEMLIH